MRVWNSCPRNRGGGNELEGSSGSFTSGMSNWTLDDEGKLNVLAISWDNDDNIAAYSAHKDITPSGNIPDRSYVAVADCFNTHKGQDTAGTRVPEELADQRKAARTRRLRRNRELAYSVCPRASPRIEQDEAP